MPKRSDFPGLPIEALIAQPLIGAAIAQGRLADEQMRSVLEYCFRRVGDHYEPIMLKMLVTRGVLEPGSHADPDLRQVTSVFRLPLVTLFPFASVAVETVDIEFDMEITAQYALDDDVDNEGDGGKEKSKSHGSALHPGLAPRMSRSEMLGVIGKRRGGPRAKLSETGQLESVSGAATYSVSVTAGPAPLTKGLLTIIDLYSNTITPLSMPTESNAATNGDHHDQ